ncbi:MAG: gliding motility-associated C-terminal domain-containing protein [Bacteroidetes bacterium]|nr:gliding motility-associated C-terminal domain-containing protein [Bacteroidota bacterium]
MRIFLLILFLSGSILLHATHNRAGEITYTQTGKNTVIISVVTYTKESSPADRPYIELAWGDGKNDTLKRADGYPKLFGPDLNINLYEATHTYPSSGEYIIAFEDPNREEGVVNIPNSVNVPFYIYTKIILNPFLGNNNSPKLLYPPIDDACLGKAYLHNPGAYDPDGDSLVYSLVSCKGTDGANVSGYFLPAGTSLNSSTGDFFWNAPNQLGDYNFAILIDEYRDGFKIGSILRDMQVTVIGCKPNDPPVIHVKQNICIEVGDTLNENVWAVDPDAGDSVTLTAVSATFSLTAPTLLFSQPIAGIDSVGGKFSWTPKCIHVRKQPYTILFKAHDNAKPVNLFDLKTVNITVIAPAPKNLTASPSGNSVMLSWAPVLCGSVTGYKIYRKEDSSSYLPDSCQTGLPSAAGYSLIKTSTTNATAFIDNNLILGKRYCYRVVAYFPDGAESKVSEEICVELKKIVPVLINVSVSNTNSVNGSIFLRWMKASQLDTIQYPKPYSYKIYRNTTLIKVISDVNDTTFTDTLINTENSSFKYNVELWNTSLIGTSAPASSIYLGIQSVDKALILKWTSVTPWVNDTFYVWKESTPGIFTKIDTTTSLSYMDSALVNGQSYCYKIESSGKYSGTGYPSPLLNFSEVLCAAPKDTVPPCAPAVSVSANCDAGENNITWGNPNLTCSADLLKFKLYYKDELNKPYTLLKDIAPFVDTTYIHSNLEYVAGCYLITAADSTGNESELTGEVCVDNCPEYSLPNIFTPNGDGKNDYFTPFPYKHIQKINLRIYDRWGRLVFQTDKPDIFWDGHFIENQEMCSSGTYFYICDVYQKMLAGPNIIQLKGFIELMGQGSNNK